MAEAARRFHHGLVVVAQVQPLAKNVADPYPVALLPDAELAGGREYTGHQFRGQGVEQGRAYRAHHQRLSFHRGAAEVSSRGQSCQGCQPLIAGVGVNRQPFEGQHLGLGEKVDGLFLAQVGEQLVVETAGVVGPGRDHQDRPLLPAP